MTKRPEHSEAAEYYFTYIDKVPHGHICRILQSQSVDILPLLEGLSESQSDYRYAADKWSIREVLAHLNDCERLFVFRAFWFARGFNSPLPSFDQNVAMLAAGASQRSWADHLADTGDFAQAVDVAWPVATARMMSVVEITPITCSLLVTKSR